MPSCSVISCRNRSDKKNYVNDGITYHIFPNIPDIKEKWINNTGRGSEWFPLKCNVICSQHFEKVCFQPINCRRLFDWAVPTLNINKFIAMNDLESMRLKEYSNNKLDNLSIFKLKNDSEPTTSGECSNNDVNKASTINLEVSNNVPATSISTPETTETSRKELSSASDLFQSFLKCPEDSSNITETPRERQLRETISRYESMNKKLKYKIINLQAQTRRHRKKIKDLEDILKELKDFASNNMD